MAAQVLSDVEKRREYDAYGHAGPPCDDGMSGGFSDDPFSSSFSSPFGGTSFHNDPFSTDWAGLDGDFAGVHSSHRDGRRNRGRDHGGVGSYSSSKTVTDGRTKVTTKTVVENGHTTVTVTKIDAYTGELISETVNGREHTPARAPINNSKPANVPVSTDRHTRDRRRRSSPSNGVDVTATHGSPRDVKGAHGSPHGASDAKATHGSPRGVPDAKDTHGSPHGASDVKATHGSPRGVSDAKATHGSPRDGPPITKESSPMTVRDRLVPTEERPPKKPRQQKSNRHRGSTCHECGQQGHFKRDCPSRAPPAPVSGGSRVDEINVEPALTTDQSYDNEHGSASCSVDARDMPSDGVGGIDEANTPHVDSVFEPSTHNPGSACQPDTNDADVTGEPWIDFMDGTGDRHTDYGASNVAMAGHIDFDGLHGMDWADDVHWTNSGLNHTDGGSAAPLANSVDVPTHANSGDTVADAVSAPYFDGGDDTAAVLQMDESTDTTTLTSGDGAIPFTECVDAAMDERGTTSIANTDGDTLATASDGFQFPWLSGCPDSDDMVSDACCPDRDDRVHHSSVQHSSSGGDDRGAVHDNAPTGTTSVNIEQSPRHIVEVPESPPPPPPLGVQWVSLADAAATGRKGRRGRR